MICPKCENEMKNGTVRSNSKISWAYGKEGKILISNAETLEPFEFGVLQNASYPSYICESCNIIVMKYKDKENFT